MKHLLTICLLILLSKNSKADYYPFSLFYMSLAADTVIDATIVRVDKNYFYVTSYLNTSKDSLLKVWKYRNWACSYRWDEYKIGQRVFLFLEKEGKNYKIMSAGGEGEIPVIDDTVVINVRCLPYPKSWLLRETIIRADSIQANFKKIGNKGISGHSFSIYELREGVRCFRSRYKILSRFDECLKYVVLGDLSSVNPTEEKIYLWLQQDLLSRKNCR